MKKLKLFLIANFLILVIVLTNSFDLFSNAVETCVGQSQQHYRVAQGTKMCSCKNAIVYPQSCVEDWDASFCSPIYCDNQP
jgi:hypothetical protein